MPRRQMRSAWGSITEVRRGVWRIRYWAEGPDGYRRRSETVRGSRKDAVERRSALMLEHGDDAPCPTVGQCWERWYRPDLVRMVEEGERAEQTLGQYDSRWRCHVGPRWADVPADEVRPLAVQQWIGSMPHSVAPQAAQVLRVTLSYAVRYEAIASNPLDADYVMPPKSTSKERSRETWDVPGLLALWADVRDEWYEAPLLLMSFGGARVAESLGVRAEEVELTRVAVGGVEVSVAVVPLRQQVRGAGVVDERLKNRWSVRPAIMPGAAGERIAEIARSVGEGWLCDGGGGEPADKYALRNAWDVVRVRGTHGGTLMKNLRASWETALRWSLKLPPWITERLLGHVPLSGGAVTAYHYDAPGVADLVSAVAEAYAGRPILEGTGLGPDGVGAVSRVPPASQTAGNPPISTDLRATNTR